MSETVLLTDTSHWSGNINFATMYQAGACGWYTKASDSYRGSGKMFEDSKFNAYCTQAFALNQLLAGCFHWLQPDTDPTNAARFYLERYFRFGFHLPPILDFEETFAYEKRDVDGNLIPTHLESHFAWCGQAWVEEVLRNVETVWIYSAKWFTDHFEKRLLSWMKPHLVITAQYPGILTVPEKGQLPLFPYPWSELNPDDFDWIWQYSADRNKRGEEFGTTSDDIDLDYFPGTRDEFLSLPGVKDIGEDMPDMQPTGTYKIVLVNGNLSVRNEPTTVGSSVLGYALAGDTFVATEKTADNWYKINFNGVEVWISGRTDYTIITEILAPVVHPEPDPDPDPALSLEEQVAQNTQDITHLKTFHDDF